MPASQLVRGHFPWQSLKGAAAQLAFDDAVFALIIVRSRHDVRRGVYHLGTLVSPQIRTSALPIAALRFLCRPALDVQTTSRFDTHCCKPLEGS